MDLAFSHSRFRKIPENFSLPNKISINNPKKGWQKNKENKENKETNRQTGKKTNRQTDKQTNRQTDKQTNTKLYKLSKKLKKTRCQTQQKKI